MRRTAILSMAILLAATACDGGSSAGDATAATGDEAAEQQVTLVPGSITAGVLLVDDIARQYLVAVPPGYDPAVPAPLIFDLHGRGGTAPGQAMTSGVTEVAWARGFVVVHPQALGDIPTWSVWPELPELENDIAFFEMMIDTIGGELSIDLDRVFVMGFSNGGGFAGRLACELSDRITAIAPVGASNEGWLECEPTHPVGVLAIHGLDDPIAPFDGAEVLLPNLPDWAAWWAGSNQCVDQAVATGMPTGTFWHWEECAEGRTVSLIALNGVGHDWPLQVQSVAEGEGVTWVGATEIIVDFFSRQ
ncbi:MAG: hypothetical protein MUP76_10545 [Acidimicrobiia bacterium]|nr:hypothetical protein [Acidimicrobiia bacterium]